MSLLRAVGGGGRAIQPYATHARMVIQVEMHQFENGEGRMRPTQPGAASRSQGNARDVQKKRVISLLGIVSVYERTAQPSEQPEDKAMGAPRDLHTHATAAAMFVSRFFPPCTRQPAPASPPTTPSLFDLYPPPVQGFLSSSRQSESNKQASMVKSNQKQKQVEPEGARARSGSLRGRTGPSAASPSPAALTAGQTCASRSGPLSPATRCSPPHNRP